MSIVKGTKRHLGCLQKHIEAALRQSDSKIGNLSENVAHRHIEGPSLGKRKTAKVIQKIGLKRNTVFISLLQEFRTAEAKSVARLGLDVRKKRAEAGGVFVIIFQSYVPIDIYKTAQLFLTHLIVILMKLSIEALNAVHCYAIRPQHTFNFGEHAVFIAKGNVAHDVKTDHIIER